jgi:hypothetical protein
MQPKAERIEILQFIKDSIFIEPWQLVKKFDYTMSGAIGRIYLYHKYGLVENPIRGKWCLSNEGERRLAYYVTHQKKTGNGQ